jgi:hypothetical protein
MSTLIRSALLVKFSEVSRTVGIDAERLIQHVGGDRACMFSPDLHVPEPARPDAGAANRPAKAHRRRSAC